MIKKSLIALSCIVLLELTATAAETTTTVSFGDIPSTTSTDKYGNNYYDREATITTKNFKVDHFWSKFREGSENQTTFTNISRKGIFRITTETTSACTLDDTLPSEGCSGQKPFLLNDEVLTNPMSGTTDTYEIAFTESADYSNADANNFYPLDISRDSAYYVDPTIANPSASSRGFFGFITSAFDFIFSKTIGFGNDFFGSPDVADVEYTPRSDDAEDRRQRYIANIIAGVDREHRMTKSVDGSTATQLNAPVINTPVSLLHYAKADTLSQTAKCKFMFTTLSSDGLMCRMMSGFGMDVWMPFFNTSKSQTTKIESSFIMGDTENSLLAMTGKIDNVPYMQDVGGTDNNKLSFLQNMLKPMTSMFSFMKTMLFGSSKASKVSEPVERVYEFDADDAMTMTFAITNDGTQVDDFANFKLLKIRSIYGDSINSCHVKKTPGMLSPYSFNEIFVEGGSISKRSPNYTLWNKEYWNSDQWIDWCQEATGKKGMFDYLFNWSTGGVFNPFNWMSAFFSGFMTFLTGSYEIKDITNTISRGLILNVQKVNLDPVSERNTRTIKVMKMSNK